jgi:glycosyltransferase involved in cell wall biosynthesis
MKVLLVHNRYQQKGGEDSVVESEGKLLAENGIEVELLETNNDGIVGIRGKLDAAASVFYSFRGVDMLKEAIRRTRPDVVHVHNWFPTFSPGIFWACKKMKVPVVHTLHNYRLLCAKASLYRDGRVCEDCIGTAFRAPGILHGCYRGSRSGTAAATAGMLTHWKLGTWRKVVDRFIALSEFAKGKLVQGGLPAEKIAVKANCLDYDPGMRPGDGGYFLYVGRLTEEKGIPVLLECWKQGPDLPPLHVAGVGPLENEVRAASGALKNVKWLGAKSSDEVLEIMGRAKALVCPSLWYEGMPRVVIEAMAVGTPVIASSIGTYPEMITPYKTGMLFEVNQPSALLACLREMDDRSDYQEWRKQARNQFLACYSPEVNLKALHAIYAQVMR